MMARGMHVLGLMSGTSADGIDAALVEISGAPPQLGTRLEDFTTVPFPRAVRNAVLRVANAGRTSAAEISQLNFRLGELFAKVALQALRRFHVSPRRVALIGSHGQTVYHQGKPSAFLGQAVGSTLQIGEPSIIAERTGITTVADFRPADMAAGGQGAPLVPFVDYLLYRDARYGRVAVNIGGIANVTAIPPAARPEQVVAFDTGPGNMVIDALVWRTSRGKQTYDRGARLARQGRLLPELLNELLADSYFRAPPPKSAGREQYGEPFVQRLVAWGRRRGARPADLVRTATTLTGLSIADALRRWIVPRTRVDQLIVSGGGAHNPLLIEQIQSALPDTEILPSGRLGVPEDAKEAFAFAILAYETFHGRPANLCAATGARHPAILGKLSYARPK